MIFGSKEHVRRVCVLYKRVLWLHRGLPQELKIIGNGYVRDEFKRHKNAPEAESILFLAEWTNYCLQLAKQLSLKGIKEGNIGANLSTEEISKLNDEQLSQLYDLKLESEKPKTGFQSSDTKPS